MHYFIYNSPENKVYHETPARFTWYPTKSEGLYTIKVYRQDNAETPAYTFDNIDGNFFTPDIVMENGKYCWTLWQNGRRIVEPMPFALAEDAVKTPLPSRAVRYNKIPQTHPRIWLNAGEKEQLKQKVTGILSEDWKLFKEKSVDPWLNYPPHTEPAKYPNDKRVTNLWRAMYMKCQDAVYAIKHMAVYYGGTGDIKYRDAAKSWLMALANWNADGATARAYNDESGFRVTTALAWGYDWLYDELSGEERAIVKKSLLYRARELYQYVKNDIAIHIKLLDSHGVRSVSMTLVPAALALFHEEEEAREWLDYALEYYMAVYTPWGGVNGGWAEGPAYWQTGVSYVMDAINLLKKSTGINIFERPFFQNTGDYPLYVYSQDCSHMAFGDMSDLGDPPGLKAGYNLRMLSAFSQSKNRNEYMWYYHEAKRRNPDVQGKFYNYGWWNFLFDDIVFKFDYKEPDAIAPQNGLKVKWFEDIGWVLVHKDMADFENHISFMFKSSPYGCVSHSHGDQNAFVLHAFGEPLAIQSGHYIGFWTSMHLNWRRQTKSKNAILIDGIGQYATLRQTNKNEEFNGSAKSQFETLISSNGTIEAVDEYENNVYMRGNAFNAYKLSVDCLKSYKRHVMFVDGDFFVMIDEVELEHKGHINWLMHGLQKYETGNQMFMHRGKKADMDVRFVHSSAGNVAISQSNVFEGADESEIEGLARQWHISAETPSAKSHTIVVLIEIAKAGKMQNAAYKPENGAMIFEKNGKKYCIEKDGEGYKIK